MRKKSSITQACSEKALHELYAEEFFIEEQFNAEDFPEGHQSTAVIRELGPQALSACVIRDAVRHQRRPVRISAPVRSYEHVDSPSSVQVKTLLFDADMLCDNHGAACVVPHDEQSSPRFTRQHKTPAWKTELDRVLRHSSDRPFLPGLTHLNHVQNRSAFITYDHDIEIEAISEATAAFIDEHDYYLSSCPGEEVSESVTTDENFENAYSNANLRCESDHVTVESLLNLIDEVVDDAAVVDEAQLADLPESQHLQSTVNTPRLGAIFNSARSDYVGYTALDQLLQPPDIVDVHRPGAIYDSRSSKIVGYTALDHLLEASSTTSEIACKQLIHASNVSDNPGLGVDDMSMSQPPQLSYFDTEIQQFVGYTAFNQLLMDPHNFESLPRISRADRDSNSDDISEEVIRETIEPLITPLPQSYKPSRFDFGLGHGENLNDDSSSNSFKSPSIDDLVAFTKLALEKQRQRLTMKEQPDIPPQVSSNETGSSSSSASPSYGSSTEFANRRDFVRPLSVRRPDFLDDEFSEDESNQSQSADDSSISAHMPSASPPAPCVAHYVVEYFTNDIWHSDVDLFLALPSTPADSFSPSAQPFPHPDVLEALDIEIFNLTASLFNCLNAGQIAEVRALNADLQWALGAISTMFPRLALMQHLGMAVEVLLDRFMV
ncbi:hypothetical protein ACEQ8H_001672 [Pleosporales sp. CAS-2024a]